MNTEKIKQLKDLVLICREVGDDTAELFEYIANLLESIDKAEPVATIIEPDEDEQIDGGTISIEDYLKLCGLPVGTKLYIHPPKQEQTLARFQPCGCQLCVCETEDKCLGCGAKMCKSHKAGAPKNYIANAQKQEQSPIDERTFENWWSSQHGDPTEIGFMQACRIAFYAGAKLSAPQVAPFVPDEKPMPALAECKGVDDYMRKFLKAQGWNDCQAAKLKGEK